MDLFDALTLLGGLCLFLFGMNIMGEGLEKSAGNRLKSILSRLTTSKTAGFFTGLAVTAVIQSSSATTVMVVGFVNSNLITLKQAINVIMGANVGTTITSWLLSLTGIKSQNIFVQLLKPTSFTPILALFGIIFYFSSKNSRKRDIGLILLGFATLIFGMDIMSGAVSGLRELEGFRNILIMFSNPILGVIAGAVLTGIVQSSSASVGILQALSATGQLSLATAIPIIMGQNIGTTVTALISSVGTNRNARRASVVHLSFNVIGTAILLLVFRILKNIISPDFIEQSANEFSIALVHTIFNILCTVIMLPAANLLERLSLRLIPEPKGESGEEKILLDERLMITPAIAIVRCRYLTEKMAKSAQKSIIGAIECLYNYDEAAAQTVRELEQKADEYEDMLSSYLIKLNTFSLSALDSNESAKLLHIIGDLERISDHAVNILESAQELKEKDLELSDEALHELSVIRAAVEEIIGITIGAFLENNSNIAKRVEPLEEVVDELKERMRSRHIARLQKGSCSVEAGFAWADLLNNFERVSDHCSNIAGCIIEMEHQSMDMHEYLTHLKHNNADFMRMYEEYSEKYNIIKV